MNENKLYHAEKYIDLHLHLDGAVTPAIARRLADMQGIELPADEELADMLSVGEDCRDLNDFLRCFELPLSLLQTAEAISECVYLTAEELRRQGLIYAEIRFAPQLHTDKGLTQEQAVKAALAGLERTELPVNLILCCMRGADNKAANLETVRLAGKYLVKDGGVTALDLAGAEGLFPTADYADIFAEARAAGIPFTIHAGEADGAESVRRAIEFGAARIGHGVRICEDEDLMALAAEKGIYLEMCPTSNRMTHAVEDMSAYPLKDFLARGLKVTLNTDDPAIENTTIAEEFDYVRKAFGITSEEERTLLENSVEAAFTSDERKAMLMKELLREGESL
ncbi:adenosine deaminase [Ruminococcus sp.]|uniref:adenosine deaminase n=1 Tax=Ruminococcus sp. TaxID=41978 RepID=UPI0025CDDC77|nr:adenosine deaminase [Ruminococcus sp.]MBQ8966277.1 adenosine deaminase [Ruminococcus sp.]